MGKKSAPRAPDPLLTASAQTATNIGTAIAQARLNNVNQVTPDGSLTFSEIGNTPFVDPNTGVVTQIPRFQAEQSLSLSQEEIQRRTDATEVNLAGIARDQSAFLQNYLSSPVNLDNDAVESRLFELGSKRLDPVLADRRASVEGNLVNKGIRLGSTAYDKAIGNLGQQENDAINQLILQGRGQAVQEELTQRNQPINEISALLSQSQVSQPNFINPGGSPIANTDVAGIVQQDFQNRTNQFNNDSNRRQSTLGGLFGLGANLIASDRRLKEDIKKVGKTDGGLNLYTFKYKAGGPMQLGVMAQEVEKTKPEAVVDVGGFKAVDYGKALSLGAAA